MAEAGYTFEVTRDLAKLDAFYMSCICRICLSGMLVVHFSISLSECKELFSEGELLLVKSGDELVSGNLLDPAL